MISLNIFLMSLAILRSCVALPRNPGVSTARSLLCRMDMIFFSAVCMDSRSGLKVPGSKQRRSSFMPVRKALTTRASGGNAISCLGGAGGPSIVAAEAEVASVEAPESALALPSSSSSTWLDETSGDVMPAPRQAFSVSANCFTPSFQFCFTMSCIFFSNSGGSCGVKSAPNLPIEAAKKMHASSASRSCAESFIFSSSAASIVMKASTLRDVHMLSSDTEMPF
mmetsp:Transcript_24557/g.68941  ORF Transcript_24557/g.68941 Transcript_24557/m.68941 type:complete len:224 (+) Transcript_24557:413-1084(+)